MGVKGEASLVPRPHPAGRPGPQAKRAWEEGLALFEPFLGSTVQDPGLPIRLQGPQVCNIEKLGGGWGRGYCRFVFRHVTCTVLTANISLHVRAGG